MAVVFEFGVEQGFHFASAFAARFNAKVEEDRVYLPAEMGEGFIQEVYLENGLALCLHRYELKQEFMLRRLVSPSGDMLTMKFDGSEIPGHIREIELGTGHFFTELAVPAHQPINFLVIVTSRTRLLQILQLDEASSPLGSLLKDQASFVLHEGMTPEIERTLKQISGINESTRLSALLYQTKAQELIYLLFTRLLSRAAPAPMAVNKEDAAKIYEVRARILADLSVTPQLPELARQAGMSLTKMKQIFRQIFGESIYNYYQAARMKQAAELLKHLSVSETGYNVGFTNLSHFTRLFEKHHQMKPKRYKDTIELA